MNKLIWLLVIYLFFTSCGIKDSPFLPQVPDDVLARTSNTNATLDIPSTLLSGVQYTPLSPRFRIFYRIYLSSAPAVVYPDVSAVAALNSDINFFIPIADPSTSAIISSATFTNRGFFELDLTIPRTGGTLIFNFPTAPGEIPTITINSIEHTLLRSNRLEFPDSSHFYLRNTDFLQNNFNSGANSDVAGPFNQDHAYVAMYIVAVGTHPQNFTRIISNKPTFISVFKLPNFP